MSKRKLSPHRPTGRPPKHGAYAIVYRSEILKKYPELARYTMDCRDGLVKDLAPGGPDTLSTAKQIILDRLVSKVLMAGQLDIFLGEHGIIRRDRIDQRILEAEPIVQTWLSINHAILRDLEALGLERKSLEVVLTPAEMSDAILADLAEKRPESDCKARSPEDLTKTTDNSDDAPDGESNDKGGKDNG